MTKIFVLNDKENHSDYIPPYAMCPMEKEEEIKENI